MVKFDEVLTVGGDGVVVASGPFDPAAETIVELCAWVYQRDPDDHGNDVAATEMTDHHGHHAVPHGKSKLVARPDPGGDPHKGHWRLPVGRVGHGELQPGEAFAVAVAMVEEKPRGNQRVIWWGHPVELRAATPAG